jgi:hypothetical protein
MMRGGWAKLSVAAVMTGWLCFARVGNAELVSVPLERQAELLARVAAYDRNMSARAAGRVQVLILANQMAPESIGVAKRMEAALKSIPDIAGLSHDERVVLFSSAADLARQCRSQHIAIVYLGSGFANDVPAIREALDGVDVLTVAAVPDYVELGVVLGFDVVSGRPKLLVHLAQARRQHVDLRAELLKLARVFE